MRRIFLIFTLLIFAFSSYSQKIESDKIIKKDGKEIRIVNTGFKKFKSFTERTFLYAGLNATQLQNNKNKTAYCLRIRIDSPKPISAPDKTRMLIKTSKDKVIQLQTKGLKGATDSEGHKQLSATLKQKMYTIILNYVITPEQIKELTEGITKVRIELDGGKPFEKSWKKDKVGEYIGKSYETLKKALSQDNRDSFTEDF